MYIAALTVIFIPTIGAKCEDLLEWPLLIAIIEFVFLATIIAIWFLFGVNNCMRTLCFERAFNNR